MKIELEESTAREWLISHFRYSLGQRTYIVKECVKDLKKHINLLEGNDIQIMIRDIDSELKKWSKWNNYVMIYANYWREFKTWLEDYLEGKEG
jgi:hypothetical protein